MTTSTDPKGVETQEFVDDRNKITARVLYRPTTEDFEDYELADDFSICFKQTKSEDVTFEYPLYYLDEMAQFLVFVKRGIQVETTCGKEFFKGDAFDHTLLNEKELFDGFKYYAQLDRDSYHVDLSEENGSTVKVIKIDDVLSFFRLGTEISIHACEFLEELKGKEGRDMNKHAAEFMNENGLPKMSTLKDPKGIEAVTFSDECNKITANILYYPVNEDSKDYDNYWLFLNPTIVETNSCVKPVNYPLYRLHKLVKFFDSVTEGMFDGEKIAKSNAFERKLLVEYGTLSYYTQLDERKYYKCLPFCIDLVEECEDVGVIKIVSVRSFLQLITKLAKYVIDFLADLEEITEIGETTENKNEIVEVKNDRDNLNVCE